MTTDEQIEKLNNSVYCSLAPSSIQGVGVFAIRDIPKDTIIWERTKKVFNIPIERLNEVNEEVRKLILDKYPFPKEGREFNSPNDSFDMPVFMNHSETPNCIQGLVYCLALRDIKKGEEITQNYRDLEIEFAELQRVYWKCFL